MLRSWPPSSALVHVKTLLLERVLAGGDPIVGLDDSDRRGLTPLFPSHVNPMDGSGLTSTTHLGLDKAA